MKGFTDWWPFKPLKEIFSLPLTPIYERIHSIHVGGTVEQPVVEQKFLRGLFSGDTRDRKSLTPPDPALTVEGRSAWDF